MESVVTPSEAVGKIAELTTYLYIIVYLIKSVLKLEGHVERVRGVAFVSALLISFGDAMYGPTTMPHINGHMLWGAFLQALTITGGVFGINTIATRVPGAQALALDPANPLAPVADAVNTAQAATDAAKDALVTAQEGVKTASDRLDEQTSEPEPGDPPIVPADLQQLLPEDLTDKKDQTDARI